MTYNSETFLAKAKADAIEATRKTSYSLVIKEKFIEAAESLYSDESPIILDQLILEIIEYALPEISENEFEEFYATMVDIFSSNLTKKMNQEWRKRRNYDV